MSTPVDPALEYANVTDRDLELAGLYFPMLAEVAKSAGRTISYGELLKEARQRHPDRFVDADGNVRETDFSTGRRLGTIWRFTHRRGYPILSALVVNASTGECGRGVTDLVDPVAERERVYAFDWDSVADEFAAHQHYEREQRRREARAQKKRRTREEAAKLLAEYWQATGDVWPSEIRNDREALIEVIAEGEEPEVAFAEWYFAKRRLTTQPASYIYLAQYRNRLTGEPLQGIDAIKIGCTNNLDRRRQELGGGVQGPIEVVFSRAWHVASGNAFVLEQHLHGSYKHRHLVGEWFEGGEGALIELVEEHLAGLDFPDFSANDVEAVDVDAA